MSVASDREACPACGERRLHPFHEQHGVPTNSCLLLEEREEALAHPRGDLVLAVCQTCGFITNTAFDEHLAEYSGRYEETQAFSPRFAAFAEELAEDWVERYSLRGGTVLEIGCGKGEFLEMMMAQGMDTGIGIDPTVRPERTGTARQRDATGRTGSAGQRDAADRITWIRDLYSERYAYLDADAVVCRHTLEHVQPVGGFMRMLRRAIGESRRPVILFELPDVQRVLDEAAFWDVYYEHCAYFSAGSLARLFRSAGFEVLDVRRAYDDQYLIIEALPASSAGVSQAPLAIEDDLGAVQAGAERFRAGWREHLVRWREELAAVSAAGGRAVVWGAGSKGVAFLGALATHDVTAAVDINPYKHDMYLAGTGHHILSPASLRDVDPDLVVAMNPVYLDEIRSQLDTLGVDARLVAV